jgi:hypothetical protein
MMAEDEYECSLQNGEKLMALPFSLAFAHGI